MPKHMHKYEIQGNYHVCTICGKKRLDFKNDGVGVRSDGKKYTKKSNINRFLFPEEYTQLEDAAKPRLKHCLICLLGTGARISEIQKVNLKTDFIFNPNGRSRLVLRHTKTKAKKGEFGSGRVRDIPLSKSFAKYLNNYLINNPSGEINFLTTAGFNIALKKLAQDVGLSDPHDFSAHSIRKTLETWLMALRVGDLAIAAHIGHDIRTASSHYVSPDIFSWEQKKLIRRIIGDLYEDRY